MGLLLGLLELYGGIRESVFGSFGRVRGYILYVLRCCNSGMLLFEKIFVRIHRCLVDPRSSSGRSWLIVLQDTSLQFSKFFTIQLHVP